MKRLEQVFRGNQRYSKLIAWLYDIIRQSTYVLLGMKIFNSQKYEKKYLYLIRYTLFAFSCCFRPSYNDFKKFSFTDFLGWYHRICYFLPITLQKQQHSQINA